jgi:hypothetical protein
MDESCDPFSSSDDFAKYGTAKDPLDMTLGMDENPVATNLPPLTIVNSCEALGFNKPLDCFWSEISPESDYYLTEQYPCTCADYRRIGSQWSGLRVSSAINVYVHRCLFNDQDSPTIYRIGQCPACNTIYWRFEQAA